MPVTGPVAGWEVARASDRVATPCPMGFPAMRGEVLHVDRDPSKTTESCFFLSRAFQLGTHREYTAM